MRKRLEFCKMGNSRILVMMIRNELTYPSRPQAMCTFFIVLHIREKKRKSRLNGNIMIIITNFPCFFMRSTGSGQQRLLRSRCLLCYVVLCAFYEKNMGLFSPIYCIPSRQIGPNHQCFDDEVYKAFLPPP